MRNVVLDASALLRFLHNEAGAERVEQALEEARQGRTQLAISAVNWGEVAYVVMREQGARKAQSIIAALRSLPLAIEPVEARHAEVAALYKERWKLPYADAFAGTLAEATGATLLTADNDFRLVRSGAAMEFLPPKP